MCFSSPSAAPQAPAVASAPPPAEAPPAPPAVGAQRKSDELNQFGKPVTDNITRVDRTLDAPGSSGAGATNPTGSGISL